METLTTIDTRVSENVWWLTVWIKDPQAGEGDVRNGLLRDILRVFKDNAIHIPYPRRDVRLIATPATQELPLDSKA